MGTARTDKTGLIGEQDHEQKLISVNSRAMNEDATSE